MSWTTKRGDQHVAPDAPVAGEFGHEPAEAEAARRRARRRVDAVVGRVASRGRGSPCEDGRARRPRRRHCGRASAARGCRPGTAPPGAGRAGPAARAATKAAPARRRHTVPGLAASPAAGAGGVGCPALPRHGRPAPACRRRRLPGRALPAATISTTTGVANAARRRKRFRDPSCADAQLRQQIDQRSHGHGRHQRPRPPARRRTAAGAGCEAARRPQQIRRCQRPGRRQAGGVGPRCAGACACERPPHVSARARRRATPFAPARAGTRAPSAPRGGSRPRPACRR